MRKAAIELALVSVLSVSGAWAQEGPGDRERGGGREKSGEKDRPQGDSRPLTEEQRARVKQILARYNAKSVTAEDAMAMNEAFRAAGFRGGPALQEAIRDAGFDPEEIGRLAPPPGRQGPGRREQDPNPRDHARRGDRRPKAEGKGGGYSIEQAISDRAQLNTIAFDALA